jgi:hypothetical protein
MLPLSCYAPSGQRRDARNSLNVTPVMLRPFGAKKGRQELPQCYPCHVTPLRGREGTLGTPSDVKELNFQAFENA